MLIVSGTKRSGTSMWMQVFAAAGLPVFGTAFPRTWGETALKNANPDGFYESILRDGIYYKTNPHPQTGEYFSPEGALGYVAKVFIPGVLRSEVGFIECVVANVRPWREYEASVTRLWALEDEAQKGKGVTPYRIPAALEWWGENFTLVQDAFRRGYKVFLQGYGQVLADPERYVRRVIEFIGRGDLSAAMQAVKPDNRTQSRIEQSDTLEPDIAAAFDELYAHIESGEPIVEPFVRKLEQTHEAVVPQLRAIQRDLARAMWQTGQRPALPYVPGLPFT